MVAVCAGDWMDVHVCAVDRMDGSFVCCVLGGGLMCAL